MHFSFDVFTLCSWCLCGEIHELGELALCM